MIPLYPRNLANAWLFAASHFVRLYCDPLWLISAIRCVLGESKFRTRRRRKFISRLALSADSVRIFIARSAEIHPGYVYLYAHSAVSTRMSYQPLAIVGPDHHRFPSETASFVDMDHIARDSVNFRYYLNLSLSRYLGIIRRCPKFSN